MIYCLKSYYLQLLAAIKGEYTKMSDDSNLPQRIPAAELPTKALDFIHDAAILIEDVVSEIESDDLTPQQGYRILRQITTDIRRQLYGLRLGGPLPKESCTQCVIDYNNCHLPPATCLKNYKNCVLNCTP